MTEIPLHFKILRDIADKSEMAEYVPAYLACIVRAFGHEMPVDETDDAMKGELIAMAMKGTDIVGLATLERKTTGAYKRGDRRLAEYEDATLRYSLGAGAVDRDYQGQGIYRQLNTLRLSHAIFNRAAVISTTTQNPKVEESVNLILTDFVAAGRLKSFNVERVLLPKFYTSQLTTYDISTKGTPFEGLDIKAGDGFSLLFHLQYPA